METLSNIINVTNTFLWTYILVAALIVLGIYFTIRTKFVQFRYFKEMFRLLGDGMDKDAKKEGKISSFQAFCISTASRVGTGNIAGISIAIVGGGPGAIFWMWVVALIGAASSFIESTLAQIYKVKDGDAFRGGPAYYIEQGLKNKKMAILFSILITIAFAFVFNAVQSNTMTVAFNAAFRTNKLLMGIILCALTTAVIFGGVQRIAKITEVIVPVFAVAYILVALFIVFKNINLMPQIFEAIFSEALNFKDFTVGTFTGTILVGIKRGLFSNEAGMGSAAITAAAATTDNPVRQGYINMTGTFWDTIVVCTITGLVIASSGVIGKTSTTTEGSYVITSEAEDTLALTHEEKGKMLTTEYTVTYQDGTLTLSGGAEDIVLTPYADASDSEAFAKLQHQPDSLEAVYENGVITGAWTSGCNAYIFDEDGTYYYEEAYTGSALTIKAFETVLGKAGAWLVTIGIALFAFSTILGWEYHGEKAFEYLFHSHKYNMIYRIIFSLVVYIGATTSLDLAWNFSDIANALMAIPNLICLLLLSKEIATDMREFQKVLAEEKAAKKRA